MIYKLHKAIMRFLSFHTRINILLILFVMSFYADNTALSFQSPPNTITFDNQAGEYALVKLVGPTLKSIKVPDGEKRTVSAAAGEYYILTRYGIRTEKFKYSKGETFEIIETETKHSKTTITLYPVVDGNYSTTPISSDEFSNIDIKNINWEKVLNGSESAHVEDAIFAAKNGNNIAQLLLGIIYVNGSAEYGIDINFTEAEFWWCQSARKGNLRAFLNLMTLYNKHIDKLERDNALLKKIQKEAKSNDAIGQYRLGVRYEKGLSLEININNAIKWYQLSANQDFVPAQYILANIFYHGRIGVEKNYEESVKWYKKAADNGNAASQDELALLYLDGKGVKQDPSEAVRLFLRAAVQNYATSQYNIGVMYLNGVGVQKNFEEAAKWFRKSAEQGFANGQYNLAVCYSVGAGVPLNKEEAKKWFEKAKENGFDKK